MTTTTTMTLLPTQSDAFVTVSSPCQHFLDSIMKTELKNKDCLLWLPTSRPHLFKLRSFIDLNIFILHGRFL